MAADGVRSVTGAVGFPPLASLRNDRDCTRHRTFALHTSVGACRAYVFWSGLFRLRSSGSQDAEARGTSLIARRSVVNPSPAFAIADA